MGCTTRNKRCQSDCSIVFHIRVQLYRPTISSEYLVQIYHHHADSRPLIVVDADEDGYGKQVIVHIEIEILPISKLVACPGLNNGQSHASPL
jgi:hypothetical protein